MKRINLVLKYVITGSVFLRIIVFSSSEARAQVYNWTTIAGTTNIIGSADGTNKSALFNGPYGVDIESSGNLYVADLGNQNIRKLTAAGINWVATTIAGTVTNSGNADGTNTTALFNGPRGLLVGNAGNIFICDQANATIRMLMAAGTNWVSSTIAGSVTNLGGADGTGSGAQFNLPSGIIQDRASNLYVADYGAHTIRKLTPSGTNWIVSTIAGVYGSAGTNDGLGSVALFGNPYDVAIDSSGNLYVTDFSNSTIRKLTPSGTNWIVSTIAGSPGKSGSVDGTGNNARFFLPTGVAVDGSGNVYVTDTYNDTIRELVPVGANWAIKTIGGLAGNTVAADGTNSVARFNHPRCLKIDRLGNVYVADYGHATIRLGTPLIPYILAINLSGTNLLINGINGLAGEKCFLFASTNMALPLNQWKPVATNVLGANGNFTFTATNAVTINALQQFYILQLQ